MLLDKSGLECFEASSSVYRGLADTQKLVGGLFMSMQGHSVWCICDLLYVCLSELLPPCCAVWETLHGQCVEMQLACSGSLTSSAAGLSLFREMHQSSHGCAEPTACAYCL